ncbi:MAG: hypothetical protein NWE98_05360 [Candidatus Bathyarchaeota archaeon]|nr:hypothetical protein [Candidatus Bathyarchaeota archaeon]
MPTLPRRKAIALHLAKILKATWESQILESLNFSFFHSRIRSSMKFTRRFPLVLLLVIIVVLPNASFYPAISGASAVEDKPFFGVTFGGNTTSEAKVLIDEVKGYINLFVVDNWDVALNETALTEICQYAYDANLYFMVYFSFIFSAPSQLNSSRLNLFQEAGLVPFHTAWLSSANDRWGDKFLGAYVLDEPGGKQIDKQHYSGFATNYAGRNQTTFINVTSYSDAANRFVRGVNGYMRLLNNATYLNSIPNATGRVIPVFTADNALYWFDYLAGYDTVFAELGWNHNEAQHIALCRGAANVQNKEWGAIITWATNDPPYMATGTQMLKELNIAYEAGAKYLIVFNYPQINPYGALTDEHFNAMKNFWNRIHTSPRKNVVKSGQVAFVLPKDYGWGMRLADDRIWGLWDADELAPEIGTKIVSLINQYGTNLDIIYDDPRFNYTEKYSTLYYWNGTTYQTSGVFNLSAPTVLYPSIVLVTAIVTCVPSYLMIKNKKRRPSKVQTIHLPRSKATLKGLGKGELEFVDDKLRFYKQEGYFKNRQELIREIPLGMVEGFERLDNTLVITWNGTTDTLFIQNPKLLASIAQSIFDKLEQQR